MVCGAAEIALNRYLRLEPSVLAECAALDGRAIEFELGAGLGFCMEFMPGGVRVMPEAPEPAATRVCGDLRALVAALRQVVLQADSGLPNGLQVEGDTELLNRFRQMLARVGFDPEEWLAPLLGGGAAHRVVGGLRNLLGWGRDNARRMADHGAEYLREESYDLARGRDVEQWMDEVDGARESLDRIEARLRRLETASSVERKGND